MGLAIERMSVGSFSVHYVDGYHAIVGASETAPMLEVAVNGRGEIFHAMPARPQHYR